MMNWKIGVAALLLAAVAVAGIGLAIESGTPVAPESKPAAAPGQTPAPEPETAKAELPVAPAQETKPGLLHQDGKNQRSPLAPGRYPMKVPFSKSGIPCGDGRFLPLLNGMETAPSLGRDPHLGPIPPIVGKIVDATGIEWWEHEDGSASTSRYRHMEVLDPKTGRKTFYWDPTSEHVARQPDANAMTPPPPGGGAKGGNGGGDQLKLPPPGR
jgi:hypothetical protein